MLLWRRCSQTSGGSIAQSDQYGIPDACLYTTPGAFYSYGGWFKSSGFSQPSEHWFTWGSTKTGYDRDEYPPAEGRERIIDSRVCPVKRLDATPPGGP